MVVTTDLSALVLLSVTLSFPNLVVRPKVRNQELDRFPLFNGLVGLNEIIDFPVHHLLRPNRLLQAGVTTGLVDVHANVLFRNVVRHPCHIVRHIGNLFFPIEILEYVESPFRRFVGKHKILHVVVQLGFSIRPSKRAISAQFDGGATLSASGKEPVRDFGVLRHQPLSLRTEFPGISDASVYHQFLRRPVYRWHARRRRIQEGLVLRFELFSHNSYVHVIPIRILRYQRLSHLWLRRRVEIRDSRRPSYPSTQKRQKGPVPGIRNPRRLSFHSKLIYGVFGQGVIHRKLVHGQSRLLVEESLAEWWNQNHAVGRINVDALLVLDDSRDEGRRPVLDAPVRAPTVAGDQPHVLARRLGDLSPGVLDQRVVPDPPPPVVDGPLDILDGRDALALSPLIDVLVQAPGQEGLLGGFDSHVLHKGSPTGRQLVQGGIHQGLARVGHQCRSAPRAEQSLPLGGSCHSFRRRRSALALSLFLGEDLEVVPDLSPERLYVVGGIAEGCRVSVVPPGIDLGFQGLDLDQKLPRVGDSGPDHDKVLPVHVQIVKGGTTTTTTTTSAAAPRLGSFRHGHGRFVGRFFGLGGLTRGVSGQFRCRQGSLCGLRGHSVCLWRLYG
mmetsp:Transcript_8167/g.24177  ORF Transcript_8167/g.24177 Transcript_8167/m.24177 type:complete len:612 (-) Transcript_8167:303-2138(-)